MSDTYTWPAPTGLQLKMAVTMPLALRRAWLAQGLAVIASPVVIVFLSTNFVNFGNLAFNMLFSRWMGPELFGDLATLLTIKLALLGFFGALQMAVSRHVAETKSVELPATFQALKQLNSICFLILWFAIPVFVTLLLNGPTGIGLNLTSHWVWLILLASLPFTAPLCILRGIVLGQQDVRSFVLSANVELGVRLGGAILAWWLGLGIAGVLGAIAISIASGWLVLRDVLPRSNETTGKPSPLARNLMLFAVPFAVLQASQVALLDGDVILSKLVLDQKQSGYVAALTLFQRIQFYGCFGLAVVLLPSVTIAVSRGASIAQPVSAITGLFALVSLMVITGTFLVPDTLLLVLVGSEYVPVSPLLWLSGTAAVLFTFSYLVATFLAALGERSGIWAIAFFVPVQLAAMLLHSSSETDQLFALLIAKLVCQSCLAIWLTILLARKLVQPTNTFIQSKSIIADKQE